jgi:hypothetical protein
MTHAKAWEFWPAWLFYAPVGAAVAALAARYGLRALTAANPGLPDGGLVGESKAEILSLLPAAWTIPFELVRAGTAAADVEARICAREWSYPLVAKPDVGQRGSGVRRVHNSDELHRYLARYRGDVLLQPWHAGPYEAGIFYVRRPGEARGRIFSLTDKRFPFVLGDGASTVAQLIATHPRYRRQAGVFLRRLGSAAARVLADGERLALGVVGNHAQGTMFVDGAALITAALEARIDAIARAVPGFFVGRFDVRYTDVEQFKAGTDLAIVELNGVSAESTNIYDPSRTLLAAYRTLFVQWRTVFEIGLMNLRRGHRGVAPRRLLALTWAHVSDTRSFPVSS